MGGDMHISPTVEQLLLIRKDLSLEKGNIIPLVFDVSSDLPDPCESYLKLRQEGKESFLLESAEAVLESKGRANMVYSIVCTDSYLSVAVADPLQPSGPQGDPVKHIEDTLRGMKVPKQFSLTPDVLNGGALGYIGYDAVRFFEPKIAQFYPLQDVLSIPEAMFSLCTTFVHYDHTEKKNRIVVLCPLSGYEEEDIRRSYEVAREKIEKVYERLTDGEPVEEPRDEGEEKNGPGVSNIGQSGYEGFVTKLKEHIVDGDIIQCVPSQRVKRPTSIHPYHIYRELRTLNPSRYMFFADLLRFHLVGSSPELLVKVTDGEVVNHPIAGTRMRGSTIEEDERLSKDLLTDEKEKAEHIMLVDLGRNDVNRVAQPLSTKVTSLMRIERYSHVMHIVSEVKGRLREDMTGYHAFRSIFPAGTVSGAPKIKAMELISKLEKEKRGVYAGAFGVFSLNGNVDTCIALRTILIKDSIAYLQAGGGIVYDSVQYDEYMETVNKMAATAKSIDMAEANRRVRREGKKVQSVDAQWISHWNHFTTSCNRSSPSVSQSLPTSIVASSEQKGNRLLMIDNYDSFTYNLYQYLCQLGQEVTVIRNDKISLEDCIQMKPDRIVISPGPSWPKDAGISSDVIRHFSGKIPVLGVCLGHECMIEVFGGRIEHCGEVVHGKTSAIKHDGKGVYQGLPQSVPVIRYHSLAAPLSSIEGTPLIATSFTENGIIMGVRHNKYTVEGVQYHPESIKTDFGMEMLKNFLQFEGGEWKQ
ncbi:putative anthranilate synthase component I [Planoprotostelium fungivorum]|uniref:Anthranilate synthase component 2 n=1 Tax=Planoprotostelium fungivorum TaxID=1890364 RepID=A0A2P6NXT6_9EUKA|nr:putative anthranilate synthase component I [Planoprotostelium fungivorum]